MFFKAIKSNDTSKTIYHQIEQKQIIHNTNYIPKIQT